MYTVQEWEKVREEYKKILQEEEYGQMPPKAKKVDAVLLDEQQTECFAGKAIQKDYLLTVQFETGDTVSFPFQTCFPSNKKKNKGITNIESEHADYEIVIETDITDLFEEIYKIAKDIYER